MTISEMVFTAVGVTGSVVTAWSAWRWPIGAVALVALSVPLQAFARVGTDDAGITWTQAWLWTFLAVGAMLFAIGAFSIQVDLISVSLVAVVVCYIVSRQSAIDVPAWSNEVYRWSVTLAFFVIARGMLRFRSSTGVMIGVTVVGAVWTGVVALVQVAGDIGPASFQRAGRPRAYASFGEPNTFGAFAASCLVVLVAGLLFKESRASPLRTITLTIGCLVAAGGLGLSQSRGAIAAFALVLTILLVVKLIGMASTTTSIRVVVAAAAIVIAALVAPRVADEFFDNTTEMEVTTATWADHERFAHWSAATAMIVESSGTGIGAGQFDDRFRAETPTWRFRIPQGHAHSAYLQVAAEAGMLGLGAYLVLLVSVLTHLGQRIRRSEFSAVAVMALAGTGIFALHNLVDYLHVLNLPIILVAWWALALGQSEGSTAPS